jgi:hypothetical protein
MRHLAGQLLALSKGASGPVHQGVWVCETLRMAVGRFAGADGFTALLRRALALAGAEFPLLRSVKLNPDGRLEGLEDVPAEAAVPLAAHLLELLVTFIGKPLTLRLLRDAWPEASLEQYE